MRIPIFQVDAFTDRRFRGNPAAVMVLPQFLDDEVLRSVARENNLAETAFLVRGAAGDAREAPEARARGASVWRLRWFTPAVEVALCGHATLASAWVITERLEPGTTRAAFHTASGVLTVERHGERFVMDFPARRTTPVEPAPAALERALGARPVGVQHDGTNLLARMESADVVRRLSPDMKAVAALEGTMGVIVTAAGDDGYDCVSRYFAPAKGIDEDPVTGSAHCGLAPFWGARLGKSEIRAYQASARGGEVVCRVKGDRVELEGRCAFYMEGEAEI
ncbi:MAG TPA: PhzF family phenazine biosynthesis protein [Polyangiaceae bacterium]